jgi:hypothetical protein
VAARRHRLSQPESLAVGAGQSMVDVDAIDRHAKRSEGVSLDGEILLVGRNACVSDQQARHPWDCSV